VVEIASPPMTALAVRKTSHLVDRVSRVVPALLVVAALCWVITVREANFANMGVLGLVSILPKTYFLGLALIAGAYGLELLRVRPRTWTLVTLTVLLVIYLFGTACAVEPSAALTSSWVHSGYVQYLLTHGHTLDNFAAEFSWPGGFSLGALLAAFAGQLDTLGMLRWFPLFFELLCALPLFVIVRASGVSRRAGWLAVGLFYSANWIYQDYFSPQAFGYYLYLCTLATVLACWRPAPFAADSGRGLALRTRFAATREMLTFRRLGGYDARSDWPDAQLLGVLGVLAVVALAMAISHQLTPYALVAALLACLVTRRLGRPELPVVIGIFAIAWLSLGASNYWVGHLSDIFGSVGQLGSLIHSNVSNRVTGSASHQRVVEARILLTMALFGLAGVGALRRAADSRSLELLGVVPFFLLFFQNYGGEGLLRVVLFSLPFASLLAASAILPSRKGQIRPVLPMLKLRQIGRPVLAVAVAGVLLVCGIAMTVVRGGNDAYETFSLGEVAAVDWAYAHVLNSQKIALVAPYAPIDQRGVGTIRLFVAAADDTLVNPGQIVKIFRKERPAYVILSRAQDQWGQIVAGFAPGWQLIVQHALERHGYKVVAHWPNAVVLKYEPTAASH
jgi:hypothetical protein